MRADVPSQRWVALLLFLLSLSRVIDSSVQQQSQFKNPPNVICVGGSSGMGKAAALAAIQRGGRAFLVSSNAEKIKCAQEELKSAVPKADICTATLDVTNETLVQEFAASLQEGQWQGLVISAAGRAPHGPVVELDTGDTRQLMETKLWGAYHCVKHIGPRLDTTNDASIVLVAGILNRRPGLNCAPLAMVNGALEGLTKSLALECAPQIRVNCLSPGFCDTERFDHMDPTKKARMLAHTAASLPIGRVGTPHDMGEAIYYLLTAPFVTGIVLDVDGGHGIRQYANPTDDPMRTKAK